MAATALLRVNVPFLRPFSMQTLLDALQHPETLRDVNQQRTALAATLAAHSASGLASGVATAGTPRVGFDVAQERVRTYLPCALGLDQTLASLPDTIEIRFDFEWTSALTRQPDKVYTSQSARSEIAMLLATLALLAMNEAAVLLAGPAQPDEPGEVAKRAASKLCEAAGLWDHLSTFSGIPLRNSSDAATRKPLEIASLAACNALACLCHAQAEEIGAFNALNRVGKLSVPARLFVQANVLYREAERHLHAALKGPPEPLKPEVLYVSDYALPFVGVKARLTLAMAHKCLGMDHHEKSSYGNAVAHMATAMRLLQEAKEVRRASSVLGVDTDELGALLRNELAHFEQGMVHLVQRYERENESVHFERVPDASQLQLPQPTSLFARKPFVLLSALTPRAIDVTAKPKQAGEKCCIS